MLHLIYHAVGQGQSKLVCTTKNSQEIKRLSKKFDKFPYESPTTLILVFQRWFKK